MHAPLLDGELRLRLLFGQEIAMGPGKADLLEAIHRTGSISAAGRELEMSYRRAWLLVDTMNRCFRAPVVLAIKGGSHGGGAVVTPFGLEVLREYRAIQSHAAKALAEEIQAYKARNFVKRRRKA
jgi:molybdate transport system regulatory protein